MVGGLEHQWNCFPWIGFLIIPTDFRISMYFFSEGWLNHQPAMIWLECGHAMAMIWLGGTMPPSPTSMVTIPNHACHVDKTMPLKSARGHEFQCPFFGLSHGWYFMVTERVFAAVSWHNDYLNGHWMVSDWKVNRYFLMIFELLSKYRDSFKLLKAYFCLLRHSY